MQSSSTMMQVNEASQKAVMCKAVQTNTVKSPYLILYQWTKFQCHTFFPSQNIKQNALLSS